MCIKLWRILLNGIYCDIRAMVGYTLHIGEQIRKHKAQLNRALTSLQTINMACFKLIFKLVNYLLNRLDVRSFFKIVIYKGINRNIHNLS